MSQRPDLSGNVVLVTGGSRGLGATITEAFLEAGADVAICARKEPDALPSAGGREAFFVGGDLRNFDEVTAIIDAVVEHFGHLDIVVNNAGGAPPIDSATASPRFSTSVIALNLLAPLFVTQEANRIMQDQPNGGLVLNISSLCGMRPSPTTAAYGAAKAGLLNLTESLSMEFAPKVRVNCVTAGALETEELHERFGGDTYFDAVRATVPLGRMGNPDDVANACLFLASDQATFITGSNLVVHGGGDHPPLMI
ncbi:MAG: SDR family oxidoreductase [Acidimicrobiales bacterium]|jgi:NAD(P)-dependent dehydrogenase (short-subunit alcohol dehydrogenase family)